MKTSLIVTAAASALLLASAAQAQVAPAAGYLGVDLANSKVNPPGPGDLSFNQYQLEGAGAWSLGQLGVSVDGQLTDIGGDQPDAVDYSLTAHVNTKVLGDARVGGFAGIDSGKQLGVRATFWGVGVEGQTKLGASNTVYGQAGYSSSNDLGNPDIWAGRAELRHFYTDNLKAQASFGYVHARTDIGKFDVWSLGVEGEYQFAGTPWSLRAGYDHARSSDLHTSDDTFRIGGRYTFDGATLKARDAAGADLNPLRRVLTGAFGF